jgi:hypothetical protein
VDQQHAAHGVISRHETIIVDAGSRRAADCSCLVGPVGLVGLVVSGLVYLIASRSLDLAPERAAIEASDRALPTISGSPTSA